MDPGDNDEPSREELESRVAELEQTVSKMLPDRRGVLKGLGAAAVGGAAVGASSGGASGQSAAGQVGTESEPVDVEGAQGKFDSVNTNTSFTDPAGVSHTGELADIDDVGGGISVEDDGTVVVSETSGLNFATNLTVTDDGDGSVTVDASGSSGGNLGFSANEDYGEYHVAAAVARYYDSAGDWDLLFDQGQGHPPLNVTDVSVDTSQNEVVFTLDNTGWGAETQADIEPTGVIASVDEDLASDGIYCGASVTWEEVRVYLYSNGRRDLIQYDGSSFTSFNGTFTDLTWDGTENRLVVGAPRGETFRELPSVTPRRGNYDPRLSSITADPDEYYIEFYDDTNTKVTSLDQNMVCWIADNKPKQLDPLNDIPDQFGNIWLNGIWSSGNA